MENSDKVQKTTDKGNEVLTNVSISFIGVESGDVYEGQRDYSWGKYVFYINNNNNIELHQIEDFKVNPITNEKKHNGRMYNSFPKKQLIDKIKGYKYIGNIFKNPKLFPKALTNEC